MIFVSCRIVVLFMTGILKVRQPPTNAQPAHLEKIGVLWPYVC
jgi:hypothetical protein